ncbi:MAG: heterodisulfide reductase-related iron-sulfur binding cluster [Candidatus Thermoplasmatota archaeon]|nr:heterodisulfide reductase-related iron-sulfur binding cluster [Candidatus Thermoplasmatota archaeon]
MGLIENLGRIADTYVREKESLQSADNERRRVFVGHAFWPHEVLRDAIILAAMIAVLCFYSWLIPPPLHSAADPFAQAGFVFPDWYVLFSYGYLRWGEYLPQYEIPAGPIGDFFGQPVIRWDAAWWGALITGLPVGILALPPFLGGRAKRGVEDPWFATAGAVYLAHVWFISVFSINIFLELYAKNRTDFCQLNSHGGLNCGVREPWITEVFNAVPWVLTGIFIWVALYLGIRWFLVHSIGARTTPTLGKQVSLGTLLITVILCSVTWPVYENGFWDQGGLGAMDEISALEDLRGQPVDTLVNVNEGHHWEDIQSDCLTYEESVSNDAWDDKRFRGDDAESIDDYCLVPSEKFLNWGIYQPTQFHLIDFSGVNNHMETSDGSEPSRNGVAQEWAMNGTGDDSVEISQSWDIVVEDFGIGELFVDYACSHRTSSRGVGIGDGNVTISQDGVIILEPTCGNGMLKMDPGSYTVDFTTSYSEVNNTTTVFAGIQVIAYQPLLINPANGQAIDRSDVSNLSLKGIINTEAGLETYMVENPTYHKNPKSLDAKLVYSLFIPCLGVGAIVYMMMRGMARGYEYEMNKCYGCDLCDDACPVRLFNAGDKLNIIYNTWNNEDDGVPMYSCLTCSACTNACPQLVDYDSYVDIRRSLIVGGPPAANIPHTVLQAVLAAEAEEENDVDFIPIEEYPIDSSIGYYPGCVDYIDQEMVFSHVNDGAMNLGETTTAAFTLFEEMQSEVTYLGRDFLKCCGHDQKWQGMTEVFEKLKAYNKKKLEASGIETLVSSCAECFHTFARDYELDGIKVMHTTEFLMENGFDMELKADDDVTVTYHDPCRLGRQMNIYDEPRDLIKDVDGVELVEMEHHGEDGLCCGVSSMMSCNEDSRALRINRFEEVRATGADIMLTSCPKCVSHFECLKFEGDPRHDFEILDVVSFLARQVEAKNKV